MRLEDHVAMMQRTYLWLAALAARRDRIVRTYPARTRRLDQSCVATLLAFMLYGFVLVPLQYLLAISHHASAGSRGADTLYLSGGERVALVAGMIAMLAASVSGTGLARGVMKDFEGHRWTLLVMATLALSLPLVIGGVVTKSVALLGVTRGDHIWIAVFLAAWSAAIVQICAAIVAPAHQAWTRGSFKRR
ncbi:hypothetical protein KZ813_10765 [Sphingomonas sp. RHCKR7]|uniref:hypothetical protein n=1 Tax=Sphingomonas folli TaxID=2862497 RepID=UPI001CA49BEB|nr:hypothetical protein [Sphingomonas folli]MBW6527322.1 hypothetical protein [Sphingomonas folli]